MMTTPMFTLPNYEDILAAELPGHKPAITVENALKRLEYEMWIERPKFAQKAGHDGDIPVECIPAYADHTKRVLNIAAAMQRMGLDVEFLNPKDGCEYTLVISDPDLLERELKNQFPALIFLGLTEGLLIAGKQVQSQAA
jgi:hypothetical protein